MEQHQLRESRFVAKPLLPGLSAVVDLFEARMKILESFLLWGLPQERLR